jgi:hypothetical protein
VFFVLLSLLVLSASGFSLASQNWGAPSLSAQGETIIHHLSLKWNIFFSNTTDPKWKTIHYGRLVVVNTDVFMAFVPSKHNEYLQYSLTQWQILFLLNHVFITRRFYLDLNYLMLKTIHIKMKPIFTQLLIYSICIFPELYICKMHAVLMIDIKIKRLKTLYWNILKNYVILILSHS